MHNGTRIPGKQCFFWGGGGGGGGDIAGVARIVGRHGSLL